MGAHGAARGNEPKASRSSNVLRLAVRTPPYKTLSHLRQSFVGWLMARACANSTGFATRKLVLSGAICFAGRMFQPRPFSSLVLSLPATLLAVSFLIGCQAQSRPYPTAFQTPERSRPSPVSVPVNHMLTPAGRQVELPGLRPQVVALSPDGQWLAVSGKTPELVLIDPATGVIRQRVPLPAEAARDGSPTSVSSNILKPDKDGQASFTGLVFSPDGRRLYLSNVNGSIKVFGIGPDQQVTALHSLSLPKTGLPERQREIPAGLTPVSYTHL